MLKKLEKAMYGESGFDPRETYLHTGIKTIQSMTNAKTSVLKMRSGAIKEGLELQLKSNSIEAIKELATQMQKLNQEIEDILMADHDKKIKQETQY